MSKRTVLAVRHQDGHLELLEPIDLAVGAEVAVTLDIPEEAPVAAPGPLLPTRSLGPMKTELTRDVIYDDLA
ncbi:MAG: hypothetical protein HY906_13955 [Deltaproteobacteria bacterium]|nr:hypothetical protein [Deltaproteobacteria bacterium]